MPFPERSVQAVPLPGYDAALPASKCITRPLVTIPVPSKLVGVGFHCTLPVPAVMVVTISLPTDEVVKVKPPPGLEIVSVFG